MLCLCLWKKNLKLQASQVYVNTSVNINISSVSKNICVQNYVCMFLSSFSFTIFFQPFWEWKLKLKDSFFLTFTQKKANNSNIMNLLQRFNWEMRCRLFSDVWLMTRVGCVVDETRTIFWHPWHRVIRASIGKVEQIHVPTAIGIWRNEIFLVWYF